MNIRTLFISNDPSLFDKGSSSRARMRAYARAIGTLHILSSAPHPVDEQEENLFLHGVSSSKLIRPLALLRAARVLVKKHDIEVVSAQDPFEHGWVAMRAVSGTAAKLHLQIHTDPLSPFFSKESSLNRIRVMLADRTLPRAKGIRVVSERVKQSLITKYGNRIVEPSVIPIIQEVRTDEKPFPAHAFSFVLMSVGRLTKEKRTEDTIAALAQVVKDQNGDAVFSR